MDAHALECLDFERIRALLASRAQCSLGRALAKRIQPIGQPRLVRRWFAQIDELQRHAEGHGLPPFGGITDVRDIVRRCAPPLRVTVEEVSAIGDALTGAAAVVRYLGGLPAESAELKHLAERIGDFSTIAERIRTVIDERSEVRDSASPKLQRIRRGIADAQERIQTTVERLLREPSVRRMLQFANHTFHDDRMVLPLRTECRGRLPGIVHRASDSGATLFVEPAEAVELNNEISNLRSEEAEEISRLLWELAHEVHINAEAILKTLDGLAVIDLIVAKVRLARDFEMRCPELADDPVLYVRNARHPLLLELARQARHKAEPQHEVVPITYRLGEDFDLLIVTGPNTGGKTVTLKTVGLLCLMVQAGLPVPVDEGSRFGVFRRILIDVGDEQSMQQSLSTFSAHMTRELDMLRKAGPRALILIDELGAGTDPDEGAAIGQALLDEFLQRKCRCIVTTHIGALKAYALLRDRAENACVEFDVESLRPTYHLRIGEAGLSNALDVAERLGVPKRLIYAARRNISGQSRALSAALAKTSEAKRKAERAREQLDTARLRADRADADARGAAAALEQKRADFEQWLQRVVHLQPGDAVRVRNFDRDGRIVRTRLDLQRAEVDVGSFTVEAPLGDLLPPEAPAPPPRAEPPARTPPPRKASPRKTLPRATTPPAEPTTRQSQTPDQSGPQQRRRRPKRKRRVERARPERPPPPEIVTLSEDEVRALEHGQRVYVRRFQRDGRFMRVIEGKKLAVVDVGLLQVEVPFDGLAKRKPKKKRQPKPPPKPATPDSADVVKKTAAGETPPAAEAQPGEAPGVQTAETPTSEAAVPAAERSQASAAAAGEPAEAPAATADADSAPSSETPENTPGTPADTTPCAEPAPDADEPQTR